ncbi:hypothetical protein DI487_09365 [Flavobacterium sediminis]|uniref:DUF3667 domain-containing protein n=1 Tax=Flavobacterium sediminis TaxID=2201181 RepID=A0A2U8QV04_9FLAO|nr:DUF3667 domain-containing protein [Flavobacterium sediminis]AWM14042.1 hypothetical protein DI487_09365 [Flavobacterium sediminis]
MGRKDAKYRSDKCLNCNTPLDISERYCHYCGQLNSTKKITISDFIEEFFSNFYAYDSKLRNSIISIFSKPGVLAKRYNNGQRFTYANPFRLFLSVSILLFLTFSLIEGNDRTMPKSSDFLDLKNDNDSIIASATISGKKETVTYKNFSVDSIYSQETLHKSSDNSYKKLKYTLTTFRNYHIEHPDKEISFMLQDLGFENNTLNHFLASKAKTFKTNDIEEEIKDYFYQKLPFLIFLSIPFITVIFWLVFYNRDINYTEHLIFVYTFYTFIFICFILFNLINLFSPPFQNFVSSVCSLLIFPYYLYRSLRNFYQLSRWKTILKLVLLHPLFMIAFIFVIFITFIFGIILK